MIIGGKNVDFKQLEAFQLVLHKGSLSNAAKDLFVSQPTITARLKTLQEELGVKLLKRNGRNVQATLAGKVFANYVSDILKLQEDAVQTIHCSEGVTQKNIHISTTSTGTYILPLITKGFQKSFPGTRLSLSISNLDSVITQLLEGKSDLGIIASPVKKSNLYSEVVGHDSVVFVAGKAHPLINHPHIMAENLMEECFIIREQGSDTRKRFENWCRQQNFFPKEYLEIDQQEAIRLAVANNLGMSVMSKFILQSESKYRILKY